MKSSWSITARCLPRGAKGEPAPGLRFEQCDWDDFFDAFLEHAPADSPDQFVPSPFNPHLGLGWLQRSLASQHPGIAFSVESFRQMPGTPYQEQRDHGTLVASHADWICPYTALNPRSAQKLAIRGTGTWTELHGRWPADSAGPASRSTRSTFSIATTLALEWVDIVLPNWPWPAGPGWRPVQRPKTGPRAGWHHLPLSRRVPFAGRAEWHGYCIRT